MKASFLSIGLARLQQAVKPNRFITAELPTPYAKAVLDLIERLAPEDPFGTSDEMGDQWCHFCGADLLPETLDRRRKNVPEYVTHWPDCPWFEARSLLGLPIDPKLHVVN